MASAGRILIMPKGDYDANSTYDNLDLVKYKGTSWLAKKESKGIEPSEANAEYWQDVFEPNIANNLTTTAEGYALDARQGMVLSEKITELDGNMKHIICGEFDKMSNGSVITLPKAITKRSVVLVQPFYNSSETLRCIFSAFSLEIGATSFVLNAYDTSTNAISTSTTLAGKYIVVPFSI